MASARSLRRTRQFQSEGWGKDESFINRIAGDSKGGASNGVIFFRGQNKQGGAVTLVGAPVKMSKDTTKPNAMNANVDGLKAVALIYQRDATHPDVNKVDVSGY